TSSAATSSLSGTTDSLRAMRDGPPSATSLTTVNIGPSSRRTLSRTVLSPEILEPIRRQLRVAHRVLDILVPKPCLQGPRVMSGISQGIAAGVAQHMRKDGEGHTGAPAEALEQRAEALSRHRTPRSLVNTYGDASCSRCRRRRARISSPCIGCTEGVPFLLLRTCSRPVLISTWCHCRSHSSEARSPWR